MVWNTQALWKIADERMEPRAACKWMVGVLTLAARADCEKALGEYLMQRAKQHELPGVCTLEKRFAGKSRPHPSVEVEQHALNDYEALLNASGAR